MCERAIALLSEERKAWRRDPPRGIKVKLAKNEDGTLNILNWECYIPGLKNTPWEGGIYFVRLVFNHQYPWGLPKCKFEPPIFHPNVHPSGFVCISILNKDRIPENSARNVILAVQNLLHDPNPKDPELEEAYSLWRKNPDEYNKRVREQAKEKARHKYFDDSDCHPSFNPIYVRQKTIALLYEEWKAWRRDHPRDFRANLARNEDGTLNILHWKCYIPGLKKTPWEGGMFFVRIIFKLDFPEHAPRCIFEPPIFHPNVHPSGNICIPIWDKGRRIHTTSMINIILAVQNLLNEPNPHDPLLPEAFTMWRHNPDEYHKRVREQVKAMTRAEMRRC